MGKGEFLDLDHSHSWIISLNAQTSEFDLEIGKVNLICKNKPSGGKERSKYVKSCQRLFLFSIALMLHFYLFLFDVLA
jgi:hypothetical protein